MDNYEVGIIIRALLKSLHAQPIFQKAAADFLCTNFVQAATIKNKFQQLEFLFLKMVQIPQQFSRSLRAIFQLFEEVLRFSLNPPYSSLSAVIFPLLFYPSKISDSDKVHCLNSIIVLLTHINHLMVLLSFLSLSHFTSSLSFLLPPFTLYFLPFSLSLLFFSHYYG